MKTSNILIALGVAVILITSGYVFGSLSAKRHMWHHSMAMKSMSMHAMPRQWGARCHGGGCGHGMRGYGRGMGCGHKMGGCKRKMSGCKGKMSGKCHKSGKYAKGKYGKSKYGKGKKHRMGGLWDLNRDGRVSPEENMNFAMRRFYTHDADGNGSLSREEFMPSGKSARRGNMEKYAGMFERLDADGDGMLELEEASAMAERHFRDADRDTDGYLSRQEQRLGMMALYGMDAAETFKKADRNADGNLSQEEFQAWMQPRRDGRRR